MSEILFITQGDHGVDSGGAAGDERQDEGNARNDKWVSAANKSGISNICYIVSKA